VPFTGVEHTAPPDTGPELSQQSCASLQQTLPQQVPVKQTTPLQGMGVHVPPAQYEFALQALPHFPQFRTSLPT
jgi:hypothetical protein